MEDKSAKCYLVIKNGGMTVEMLKQLLNTPGGEDSAIIYSILRKKTFGELGGDPFIGDVLIPFDHPKIREKFRHYYKADQIRDAFTHYEKLGLIRFLGE